MFFDFKQFNNAAEDTKESESAVDHSTLTRWFKKFWSSCKNLDDQARSVRPKSVACKTLLQTIDVNLVSCTQRVSGEPNISLSSELFEWPLCVCTRCGSKIRSILI